MEKQPYTPPKIVRVKLEHQQAVLAACSVSASVLMANSSKRYCKPTCRKGSGTLNKDDIASS